MINRLNNLLIKANKYTKLDNVYIAKHGFWLTLGQFISSASSLIIALVFANFLPEATYGTYKYVLSVVSILGITTMPGIDVAIVRAISRGYEGSLKNGLKAKIYWGFWGFLGSLLIGSYYYFKGDITLAIIFLIVAGFIPFFNSFSIYLDFLNGKKLFKTRTNYIIIVKIIVSITLSSVVILTKNIFLIILSYFVIYTLLEAIILYLAVRKYRENDKIDHDTIPYGKHLTFIGMISNIAHYLDQILIFHYIGPAQLATYAIALAPTDQLKAFLKNAGPLAFPKLAVSNKENIKKVMFSKMIPFIVFIAAGVIIYIILSPSFFAFFFPKYIESTFYSQILAISLIASVAILPQAALKAQMAQKQIYWMNIITPIFHILMLVSLIPFYGIWGVVFTTVITRFFNAFLVYYLTQQM